RALAVLGPRPLFMAVGRSAKRSGWAGATGSCPKPEFAAASIRRTAPAKRSIGRLMGIIDSCHLRVNRRSLTEGALSVRIACRSPDFHAVPITVLIGHSRDARYNGHRLIPKGIAMFGWCLALAAVAIGAEPEPPRFLVHSAAGEPITGNIQSLDKDWTVTLAGDRASKIPGSDFVSLRRKEFALPPLPAGRQI